MDMNTGHRSLIVLAVGGIFVVFAVLLLASGGGSNGGTAERVAPDPGAEPGPKEVAVIEPVDPSSLYDPLKAGDATPTSYIQLLRRDQIAPIYNPSFTTADDVDWPLDALIVGVTGTETSKAYPVSHLNRREMVIDHIDGDPILVSW
jgi:hypothetical protein